jgi:hypothetical protein
MTTEDIIKMAQEAGIADAFMTVPHRGVITQLERFANLVRDDTVKAEREACAKAVINIANEDAGNPYKQALRMGAEAIRARGNT